MYRKRITLTVLAVFFLGASLPGVIFPAPQEETVPQTSEEPSYDIVLRGGRVFDGSGNPWVYADVAIKGNTIEGVGDFEDSSAKRVIDVTGKFVMPGIIDLHSHANSAFDTDDSDAREDSAIARATINNLTQGITTVLFGEGGSIWGEDSSIQDKAEEWSRNGIGTNAAMLAGIGSIRTKVLGAVDATPTPDQLEEMKALVRKDMEGGAFGISNALDYWNGHFLTTEEIVALAQEAAAYGGMYVSHIRSEGTRSLWWVASDPSPRVTHLDAIQEIIDIGREAGIRVHILHIKSTGIPFWGRSRDATALIEKARAEGIDITADQYPYTSSGPDRNTQLFKWEPYLGEAVGRDLEAAERKALIRQRMEGDAVFATQLEKDDMHEILARGGADRMFVRVFEPDPSYVGRTLEEIAELRGENFFETGRYLQLENDARIQSYSMVEDDLHHYMTRDYIAPATDGGAAGSRAHPRSYGTFPRMLRKYVLDEGVITLPFFVRKVTSFPASILGIKDRGYLKEGYKADILVFDAETIQDRATFDRLPDLTDAKLSEFIADGDPHQNSEGIEYLLINGALVIDGGEFTGELAGEVILRR